MGVRLFALFVFSFVGLYGLTLIALPLALVALWALGFYVARVHA